MQRMSVLKGIKKIRCFWKLFWNIKWNVELMSCVCVILKILVWSYRYQLMVGGTSSWSVQITSANQPTPVEYLRTLRLLREIPKWMIIPCGNMNMGRPSRNDRWIICKVSQFLDSNKVSHWDKTFSSLRSLHICRYSQNRWSQNALFALEI